MINTGRVVVLARRVEEKQHGRVFRGIDDSEIDGFTSRTGIKVPPEYRAWLRLVNGACLSCLLYGIRTSRRDLDLESEFRSFPIWHQRKWIPIGNDGCGNRYIIPTHQEFGDGYPVLFMEMTASVETPSYICASGVGPFLEFFLEELLGENRWPFDKEYVLQRDPEVAECCDSFLPWRVNEGQ